MEYDGSTNSFRHLLAETVFKQAKESSGAALAMCSAIHDFSTVKPRHERNELEKSLRNASDEYYDEYRQEWTSDQIHTVQEANWQAQRLHRYRLIVFSNFLATLGAVERFEPNILDVLEDAQPGTVLLVMGGKGGEYPAVYMHVDQLARQTRFRLKVEGVQVSVKDTPVATEVFQTGKRIFELLAELAPTGANLNAETRSVSQEFRTGDIVWPSSEIRVFRKYGKHGRGRSPRPP